MDTSSSPQKVPGDEDDLSGVIIPNQTEVDLNDWIPVVNSHLDADGKEVAGTSRLLFLTVEYVEEPTGDYTNSGFASFEPVTSFSPHISSSLSEFEQRVSPLDPNMSSGACYSPVYTIDQSPTTADVNQSSNSNSPFQNQPETEDDKGLLQEVEMGGTFYHESPTGGSPHSSGSENYVVSSSGTLLNAIPSSAADFVEAISINVDTSSPGVVDSTSDLLMHSSQLVPGAEFSELTAGSTMVLTSPNQKREPGALEHFQVVISSSDGENIAYSIDGQTTYINSAQIRADLLTAARAGATTFEDLEAVINLFKSHGVIIESVDESELRGEQLLDNLNINEVNLTGTSEPPEFINSTLLESNVDSAIRQGVHLDPEILKEGVMVRHSLEHTKGSFCEDLLMEGTSCDTKPIHSQEDSKNLLMEQTPCDTITLHLQEDSKHLMVEQTPCDTITLHLQEDSKHLMAEQTPCDTITLHLQDDNKNLMAEQTSCDAVPIHLQDDSKSMEVLRRSKRLIQEQMTVQTEIKCEACNNSVDQSCPQHAVQSISDKPVPSRAWATLPATYLSINKTERLNNGESAWGVFARKTIPKRTQFGPMKGVLLKDSCNAVCSEEVGSQQVQLLVESDAGEIHSLDVFDENLSNWMRFVRGAETLKEQNLILNQQGSSLYFTTTRVIHPREELRVWYSSSYASKRGLALLDNRKKNAADMESTWPCFECNDIFFTSKDLQRHLNIHDTEKGKVSLLTKKRRKKYNLNFRKKTSSYFSSKKLKIGTNKNVQKCRYKCTVCQRRFPCTYSLKKHQMLHSSNNLHTCPFCGEEFYYLYNRNSCSEWICTHCALTFDNPSILNLHTLAHAAKNLEEAEVITGLPLDFLTVYNNGDIQDFHCPQCKQQFPSKVKLIDHVSIHGKAKIKRAHRRIRGSVNPAKPWKCELCYKSFATQDRLQHHRLVHGSEELKPLQCVVCCKRFLNNSALACHAKTHSEAGLLSRIDIRAPMTCKSFVALFVNGCSEFSLAPTEQVFDEYNHIRKHVRAFHNSRCFTCDLCKKAFPRPDKLKLHMLRHSDHREFLCAHCGKQFKRKDKLKEHMTRMHSVDRELRMAVNTPRTRVAKKFMPKVSPNDYHRFIYKCHTCLVGFKRRGMLVNHLANRHPDVSPDSVPELNLPILKTTRDYFCQYCDKVYKSSSKRKVHILKNHPGAELPMSNRRKGGVPDIPGLPNPTFSQTVGSVTTHPHGCPWCHKQYASKAKLLQHQRKKHSDLLTQTQQPSSEDGDKNVSSPSSGNLEIAESGAQIQVQLQGLDSINLLPGDYQITTTQEELREFQESGLFIDASLLKRPMKGLPDGLSADLLSQAMSELSQSIGEFRLSMGTPPHDHYFKIVHSSPGHIMLTTASSLPSPSETPAPPDSDPILEGPYSPPTSWANTQVAYTPYTAR
uniref:PR domain zinc finger protein 10 n=1 Tax=Timema cristinae TaxID=61476 RepID=A0A7R9CDG0_TIMCR|nr:unnamed protein product [Timema cristinae]